MKTPAGFLLSIFFMAAVMPAPLARGDEPTPLYRTLPKPRILYIAETTPSELTAETLRAQTPASVTYLQLYYNDQNFHHLCDKPLEESKEDMAVVLAAGKARIDAIMSDLSKYDVIFTQFTGTSTDPEINKTLLDIDNRILKWVRAGGKLVVVGTAFEGTPLADVMPCKPGNGNTWTIVCEGSTDHPFSRGLPFEVTGSHIWCPLYVAADASCLPLTVNQADEIWWRLLPGGGQTVYLYSFYGQRYIWNSTGSYPTYEAQRPDDGAVWNEFLHRLMYGLVYGDRAFPVLAKIALPPKTGFQAGEKMTIPVDVENRAAAGGDFRGSIALEVSDRRSPEKVTARQVISLGKGERKTFSFDTTIDLPGADNVLLVRARVLDETGKLCLSESTSWVSYAHRVPLTVTVARPSYRPGEAIQATVAHGDKPLPAGAVTRVYLVDHTGRVIAAGDGTKDLAMPDGGPEFVGSYWLTAQVCAKDRILGTALRQVQVDRPWDMRRQVQWSVWSGAGDPRTLGLFRDAGFNALGYPGNSPAADRFAMRQYVEGVDINTFGVTIDSTNWDEIRAGMKAGLTGQEKAYGPDSRSKALVSLGEESGFKNGWGQRYYWDGDKAPAIPQKVFDGYLSGLYSGDIATLNDEWGTQYKSFDEVPLEKAKSRAPEGIFVNSQAWEATQKAGQPQTYPVDVQKVDPGVKYLAKTASFYETNYFYDWYYQKFCDAAMDVYRKERNPVPLSIMSAPVFYPKVDVYNFGYIGAFYPKEIALQGNAAARRDYGDVPGFGLMWEYFDLHALWSVNILSNMLVGNTHFDYWVDFPLTFNTDLTHTRASFWTKALTRQVHPIEPILLHKRFEFTRGLGMFIPPQPLSKGVLGAHFGSAVSPNAPIYSALEESGYMPRVVPASGLRDISVLVASYAEVISPAEGKAIADFVKNGGLLIATPWLADCSSHGNLLSVYPAAETGLPDLLGFKLLNTSQSLAPVDVVYKDLKLTAKGHDKVLDLAADVEILARYPDGTPLVLRRKVGWGRVVYLNFVYDWNGWWNSFYEPGREAYRQLIDRIIREDGRVTPEYRVTFQSAAATDDNKGWWGMVMPAKPNPGEGIAWWSSQLYSDPSGKIKYLAVFTDHRSPLITSRVQWAEKNVVIFDLFTGEKIESHDGRATLTLPPGGAAFWAILPQEPRASRLEIAARVSAGSPIKVEVTCPHSSGVALDVYDPSGQISRCHSVPNVQLTDGKATIEIPTADNDPPGEYRVVATESITRAQTERKFKLTAPESGNTCPAPVVLTPFPSRASEQWPAATMSSEEFVDHFRKLAAIYTGTFKGLEAKYMLSYFLDVPFRDANRHALMRELQRTDWAPHLDALADAIRSGETFYLLGEDLNVDPETGLTIDPFAVADPAAFLNRLSKLPGARRETRDAAGLRIDTITLGKGAMIVSPRSSVDRAAYLSADFVTWHERTKAALGVK